MPRSSETKADRWRRAQQNPTYRKGALEDHEGASINWHSPDEERSSQIFCISAFGSIRSLVDGDRILDQLFAAAFPGIPVGERWKLQPEYSQADLLGETGQGTPTSVDMYCENSAAVICIESKFRFDALDGFGGCGQVKPDKNKLANCAGFYGPGSDTKTKTSAFCRLQVKDGRRAPRNYWDSGRAFFASDVFREQAAGDVCPFKEASFQLMRNFLLAAKSAGDSRSFGVLAMAPEKNSGPISTQLGEFRSSILRSEFRSRVAVGTYDELVRLLLASPQAESRKLGGFLAERMAKLA